LLLEGTVWRRARSLSYNTGWGLEEGLAAHGIELLTIPEPWYPRARQICGNRRFDQVWVEIGRLEHMDESFLDWVATRAPIRLGLIAESLHYTAEEVAAWPNWQRIMDDFPKRLAYVTHILTVDEADTAQPVPALWWPQAVPRRFVTELPPPASRPHAVFCGNPYPGRDTWLAQPALKTLLQHVPSAEAGTIYPHLFNAVHLPLRAPLRGVLPGNLGLPGAYNAAVRALRRRCFQLWLQTLQTGTAVVNLPHRVKGYAGRVVEAMAAGRPVVSWQIPDRPRNRGLFEDGQEMLLFDTVDQLTAHLQRLQRDEPFARQLAANARTKLLRFHTLEHRTRQVLDWLETGRAPDYGA
jgi:hypothetical protein